MAEGTNPVRQTVDHIESLGKWFTILLLLFPAVAGLIASPRGSGIWGLLALTAPFTASVAVVTYITMRGKVQSISGLLLSATLLLIGLSLVSRWIGLGTAIDVGKFLGEPTNLSGNILTLLWKLLLAYFELYKPATFFAAIGCGIYLGYRWAKQAAARENAAKELKSSAAAGG